MDKHKRRPHPFMLHKQVEFEKQTLWNRFDQSYTALRMISTYYFWFIPFYRTEEIHSHNAG